jgi:hypothetical protein
MANNFIPPSILVLAAASRLIDLHQSRRQTGVYAPDVPENAGRNLGVALMALTALRDIEMERGFGFVTVEELHLLLCQSVDEIDREELEFVLASLAQEREIHYALPNEQRQLENGRTRKTTNLIIFADSQEQVKITDNGRLFLRICDDEQAWLYSDSDTKKLITALTYNKFHDIPTLCRTIGQDLAAKGAMLADLIARPTRQEQRSILVADGQGIGTMLVNAKSTVREAMAFAFNERTFDDFENWKEREGSDLELGNIQAELETLLRIVEAVSRKFTEFLDTAQQRQDVMITEYHFLGMVDNIVPACNQHTRERLESLIAEIIFPYFETPFFHPSVIPGEIDLAELLDVEDVKPRSTTFELTDYLPAPVKRFRAFIDRHRDKLYAQLASGPLSFSDIINSSDFELLPGESALDFVGIYITPDALDGSGESGPRLVVGFTGSDFVKETVDASVVASDPLIFIEGAQEG